MKYEDIHASNDIYCSSSGHYSVKVYYTDTTKTGQKARVSRDFDLDSRCFLSLTPYLDWWSAPDYLVSEVMRQLRNWSVANTLKVHEYNRDGIKRYDDLRYHEPDHLKWLIEEMK